MSTQQAPAIDFSIAQDLAHFRLVELPEEVVQLLTADAAQILELKSDAASGTAVVCSQTKSFPIRSVHTSNSLYVVQSVVHSHVADELAPRQEVRGVSLCSATLELTLSTDSAVPHLRNVLPEYSSRDLNVALAQSSSYQSIMQDVPLSTSEVQEAWASLCAFEHQGASFRPTASILLELWRAFTAASLAENVDLESAFLLEDMWAVLKDEDFPKGLFEATMSRISDSSAMDTSIESERWVSLDKKLCAIWVASLILETKVKPGQAIDISEFEAIWRDVVPERWRSVPNLSLIQNVTTHIDPSSIALKPECRLAGPSAGVVQAAQASVPLKARKWHDKFRRGRT